MQGDALPIEPPFSTVREATRLFRMADDPATGLAGVIGGLREIVFAAANGDLFRCDVADLNDLRAVIAAACDPAMRSAGRVTAEAVMFGLGAASGLVGTAVLPPERRDPILLTLDRLDHAALLADELDADLRRRRIEDRGDPLRRSIRIAVARDTPAAGQPVQ